MPKLLGFLSILTSLVWMSGVNAASIDGDTVTLSIYDVTEVGGSPSVEVLFSVPFTAFDGWHLDDVEVRSCVVDPAIFLDGFEIANSTRWTITAP